MIISSNDKFLLLNNNVLTASAQSGNYESFTSVNARQESTANSDNAGETNRSYPAENGLTLLLDETNRSYPAQGPIRSLLDGTNRSYPAADRDNLNLAQAEATRLLEGLDDPFLEFLLNQEDSEETDIFDLVNTNSEENQNLVEAFFAEPNRDIDIGTLVFSNLYA